METYDLTAVCAFGLEAVVRRELAALGLEPTGGETGQVHFRGDQGAICRANLWLRTADRVVIRVASFAATDFDALFETTKALPWGEFLPADGEFPVTGRSLESALSSVPACQRSVKRAIVEALRRDHGVDELPETGARYAINVALLKDTAVLTLDTTGPGLHRRGYRQHNSPGALKETLAAALVMLSFWEPQRPLLDPCCGSGTIAIEAALLGRRIAPGRDRTFACESWPGFPSSLWQAARRDALTQIQPPLEERIVAGDRDPRVLRVARQNAERAGVAEDIHFEVKPLEAVSSSRRFGCLITHSPYFVPGDDRSHSPSELDQFHALLPEVLRKLPTWSQYFLTAYPRFEQVVGREADRRRKLYNGRTECTYYQFHGPRPTTNPPTPEQAAAPDFRPYVHAAGPAAFGQLGEKAQEQAALFRARLTKRAKHLRRWPARRGITCFRLYERDIPEIPLVVDRYEDYLHITEYERPHDRDPAQHANWLDLMAQSAAQALEVPPGNVFLKRRRRQRGTTQHEKYDSSGRTVTVQEGGLQFLVNLSDYVDTGLFLDHRITRGMVRDMAAGTRVLNLFCYTGAFTVYAAAGGAAASTSVDLSQTYLDWAARNMQLNGLDGPQHQFIAGDVPDFVRRHRVDEPYDLVILDPPTFSNSKRTERDWDVQRDAVPLLNDVLRLVRLGGTILFSTNFRRFKFDPAQVAASQVHEISNQTVPEDFRNRRIHRCWRLVK